MDFYLIFCVCVWENHVGIFKHLHDSSFHCSLCCFHAKQSNFSCFMIELSVRNRNVGLCPVQEGWVTQKKREKLVLPECPFRLVCYILFKCIRSSWFLQKKRLSTYLVSASLFLALPEFHTCMPSVPGGGGPATSSPLCFQYMALSPFRHTQEWLSLCVQVESVDSDCFWVRLDGGHLKLSLL